MRCMQRLVSLAAVSNQSNAFNFRTSSGADVSDKLAFGSNYENITTRIPLNTSKLKSSLQLPRRLMLIATGPLDGLYVPAIMICSISPISRLTSYFSHH